MKKYFVITLCTIWCNLNGFSQSFTNASADKLITTLVKDVKLTAELNKAFDNLAVDINTVKSKTGIPVFKKTDFDFVNVSKCQIINEPGTAISAKYIGPSVEGVDFNFMIFGNGDSYQQPMIGKAYRDKSEITYFDLADNNRLTIKHNTDNTLTYDNTYTFFGSSGSVIVNFKRSVGCGQKVADCIADAYSNHGWGSVWLTLQSLVIWQTGAAIIGACIAKNCIPRSLN